jgi:DNA-binding PadR family transcriptional regulator
LNPTSAFKAPQGLLRCVVLAYAAKYPITGSELASDIREKTGGVWDPSPGSVYFLMNELREKNLLILMKDAEAGRKAYIVTAGGKVELEKAAGRVLMSLRREVTLLALLVSMVDPAGSERMEVLNSVLGASPAQVSKIKQLMK